MTHPVHHRHTSPPQSLPQNHQRAPDTINSSSPISLLDAYTIQDVLLKPKRESGLVPDPTVEEQHATFVGHRLRPRELVEISADSSVGEAVDLMRKYNILALAVFGQKGRWIGAGLSTDAFTKDKQYIGLISILDIVIYLTNVSIQNDEHEVPFRGGNPVRYQSLDSIRVIEVVGESDESQSLWLAKPNETLLDALEPMGKGVHRFLVPIMAEGGPEAEQGTVTEGGIRNLGVDDGFGGLIAKRYEMCTQTDVIRFLLQHLDEDEELSRFVDGGLEELGLVNPDKMMIITVDLTAPLLPALKSMSEHNLNAVAVVNTRLSGVLVGTLSMSDLRAINKRVDIFQLIKDMNSLTVSEFLRKVKGENAISQIGAGQVACYLDDDRDGGIRFEDEGPRKSTLRHVMELSLKNHVHRVWVINRGKIPEAVVSMSDMIRKILEHKRSLLD
ncbi:hypothetical protein HK102_011558 [Quaeritorhiza haematococci]|nr:hypothetical protein HK102_011558 [Quaeritorhiza haematococci]